MIQIGMRSVAKTTIFTMQVRAIWKLCSAL